MSEKEKKGWLSRLTSGLRKTSDKLSSGITSIFTARKLDEEALTELEELLLTADIGVQTMGKLIAPLRKTRFGQEVTDQEIRQVLADEIIKILEPYTAPLKIDPDKTNVLLIVGVNGGGKTTTLSKIAKEWKDKGYKVRMVAGDTFRAAAVAQLKAWGERLGIPVEATSDNGDAAGLAYDGFMHAKALHEEVILIDTAGRLHNREDLMAELEKIARVLKKVDETAPHQCLLVLDATTGQNLITQVETFQKYVPITGLVMTKLDGTARGGVLLSIVDRFHLPVHAIGVGEKAEDLRPFKAEDFAATLVGLEPHARITK